MVREMVREMVSEMVRLLLIWCFVVVFCGESDACANIYRFLAREIIYQSRSFSLLQYQSDGCPKVTLLRSTGSDRSDRLVPIVPID